MMVSINKFSHLLRALLYIGFFATIVHSEGEIKSDDEPSYVMLITESSFDQFIKDTKNVKILYFYKKELPRMKKFREEFKKSASYLSNYEVDFGWVDCTTENIKKYCAKKEIEKDILAFKDGELLLDLTLETMFDVNSMVSNVLQIVLLKDVPILQSKMERKEFETKHKGKNNIFFGYFPAIGTYEHRVFMEVAYSNRHEHRFALTTERDTVVDIEHYKRKTSIWCFQCKNVAEDDVADCSVVQHKGKLNVVQFANFVKSMTQKAFIEMNKLEDLDTNPFPEDIHLAIIFYDVKTEKKARSIVEPLSEHFRGTVGFILCNTEKIDATQLGLIENIENLPTLAVLFKNEEEPVFMENLDLGEHGLTFINQELDKRDKVESDVGDSVSGDEHDDIGDANDPGEVEKMDDQVALGAYSLRKEQFEETYLVLNDKNFFKETESGKLTVVLFHLPFDIRSQAFIRTYNEVSRNLAQEGIHCTIATLNCFDWTDVCSKVNISSYPLINIYRKGMKPISYKGLLDYSALINSVRLYSLETPQALITEEDVKKFSEGQIPERIGFYSNVSVLAIATGNKDISIMKDLAKLLHGDIPCGLVTGNQLAGQVSRKYNCQPPCLVIHKRNDDYQPTLLVKYEDSASRLAEVIKDARVPIVSTIAVDTFPILYARKQPILILFGTDLKSKEGLHQILGNIATSNKFPSAIFTFIDFNKQRNLGGILLSQYQLGTKLPSVLMINVHKHTIYKYNDESITEERLSSWVGKVLGGTVEADRLMEKKGWFPKHPGYDYQAMMDEELKNLQEEEESGTSYEEENLGFNDEGEEVGHEYDGTTDPGNMEETMEQDDIEEDLHELKKSRLFHTRDTGHEPHKMTHSTPSKVTYSSDNGHVHNEL